MSHGRYSLVVSILALLCSEAAWGQNVSLRVEEKQVLPGEEFTLDLLGALDRPIRGFQIGVQFPQHAMTLLRIAAGADLGGTHADVFDRTMVPGSATVKLILDSTAPFTDGIPAGDSVGLARFTFRMGQGFSPGAEFPIGLAGGLGTPPLPALIYAGAGTFPPAGLTAGAVQVMDRNVLRIRDVARLQPGSAATLEFSAFNLSPLQGFSVGVKFDPTLVRFLNVDLQDTITAAVGAEYVAPIFDNVHGIFLLGVLLDSIPPFQNQVIPATGLDLTIFKVNVQLLNPPSPVESVDLELADGLGAPPIRNVFIIDNQSVEPVKQNGRLNLLTEASFVRGDANHDGKLDITDPIATADWLYRGAFPLPCEKTADTDDDGDTDLVDVIFLLRYLFEGGTDLPPPYPAAGLDPTPDDLPCPL
jgi:hypothetical protein